MSEAFLVGGVRTPFGRYGGALAGVRPDDLAALVVGEVARRYGLGEVDEVILGAANQAGEDNRNVARMAVLLSGLPETVPGVTVNRLCGSGLEAVLAAARLVRLGEADLVIAGGVESMSRAPFVVGKSERPFERNLELYDTTLGWRFINPRIAEAFGTDSMGETAENVAAEFGVSREDQDAFAQRSQERAAKAQANGRLAKELLPVETPAGLLERDEHPRLTSLERLAALRPVFREGGSVTAGNASGLNDGAAAVLVANEQGLARIGAAPLAVIRGGATAGVPPRIMGIGPVPASRRVLARLGLEIGQVDLIELNEAFAAQVLASLRQLGVADEADWVNPNGGAIALGHPLGASGTRLVLTAAIELNERSIHRALVTMCIGVGQGIAAILERP
jgi:3-oxoadipyl-CoA thiolase